MVTSKVLTQKYLRQFHKFLAPIMLLPLVLTAITGATYQMFDLAHQETSVPWLLALHKGHFGILNLTNIYPFLNALGLIILAVTGFSLWLQKRRKSREKVAQM